MAARLLLVLIFLSGAASAQTVNPPFGRQMLENVNGVPLKQWPTSYLLQAAPADDFFAGAQAGNPLGYGVCTEYGTQVPCTAHYSVSRASAETCQWADGHLSYAGNNVACITDLGMGIWESRTNISLYSVSMSNTGWSYNNVTNNGLTLAPDGTVTAVSVSNTASVNSFVAEGGNPVPANSTTYTLSLYVKAVRGTGQAALEFYTGTAFTNAVFNAFTGAVPTCGSGTCTATLAANGFYRFTYTVTTAATGTPQTHTIYIGNYGSTPTATTVQIWGFQVEQGSFATPYIPTTTVAVTRNADAITTVSGSVLDTALRVTPGSVFVQTNGLSANGQIDRILRFSTGGWYAAFNNASQATVNSAVAASPSSGTSANRAKVGLAYDGTNATIRWGSGTVGGPTANSRASATGTIQIGDSGSGTTELNGYIERLAVFPNIYALPSTYP